MLENGEMYVQSLTTAGTTGGIPLPEEFIAILPKTCPECGTPTLITSTLTTLYCPSEDCGGKAVKRLETLAKDLGVKGFGESSVRKFFTKFKKVKYNPYAIFAYSPYKPDGSIGNGSLGEGISIEASAKIYKQFDVRRTMKLWEYVKIGNLKGLRDRALSLFGDYNSLDQFYEDFEAGGVQFIQRRLGISGVSTNSAISVTALELAETLSINKQNLLKYIQFVNIEQVGVQTILVNGEEVEIEKPTFNMCMSTKIGGTYGSKEEYAFKLKEHFKDYFAINVIGGVSDFCDVLIFGGGDETTKVRNAKKKNDKRAKERLAGKETKPDILVLSGDSFWEHLERLKEEFLNE